MLRRARVFLLLALPVAASARAQAPFVGPRATAMGGAAVAVADDGTALWTNPAGLARDLRLDVELFGSAVATNRNEFTTAIDRLSSIDPAHATADDIATAIRELQRIAQPGSGIVGSGVAGLMVGKSGIAVGIGDVAFAGVYPTIDLTHVLPGGDPVTGFVHNASGLSFAGLEAREARVAYATSFFQKVLLVGGTLRYIQGKTYFVREGAFQENDTDPWTLARRAFRENEVSTNKLALDAGVMVNILGKVRAGLVSTAINEPEFRVASSPTDPTLFGAPATLKLPRTLRAGVAAQPIGMLTVAADYDLRATPTLVPGARSRQFSFGAELKLPLFAVRGGVFRDTAAVDPHWAYSAGVGVGFNVVSINASVVLSSEGGLSLSSTNRRDIGAALDARVRF
jgi:hypothetical protein